MAPTSEEPPRHRPAPYVQRARAASPAALAFLLAIAGAVGFGWAYVVEASIWWLGGFITLGLLGLGAGITYWGLYLHPEGVARGEYPYPRADEAAQAGLVEELDRNQEVITRRRFLALLLGAGAAILGIAALFPVQSMGPLADNTLFRTQWRKGTRLVTIDGRLVDRDAVARGDYLIAFPEGHIDSDNSMLAVFRVPVDKLRLPPGREGWAPDGYVAYSQVCTHAGCPVTQYEDSSYVLLCSCHESVFDILQGAKAISGPAARALPQLPLMIGSDGILAAQSDFQEPIGPGFWNLP